MVVKMPRAEKGKKAQEIMIPYIIEQVVKNVDLDKQVIEVDWDDEYI
jgi:ribosomal 30S subunit maturation factor RimM